MPPVEQATHYTDETDVVKAVEAEKAAIEGFKSLLKEKRDENLQVLSARSMLLTIVCSDMHGHQLTDSLFPHAGIRQHGAGLRYLAVFSGAVPYRK